MVKSKSRSRMKKGGNENVSNSYQNSNQIQSATTGIFDFFSNAWNDTKKGSMELFDNLSGKKKDDNYYPVNNSYNNSQLENDMSNDKINNYGYNNNPNISSSTSITRNHNQIAGKKRNKKSKKRISKSTRSKRGGTNIATSAAPIDEFNVAKPTYWIRGGKGRRTKKKCNKIL